MPGRADTLELPHPIDDLERLEAMLGPQIEHLVKGVVDNTPSALRREALVRVMTAATEELRLLNGGTGEAVDDSADLARVQAIGDVHADTSLTDWRGPRLLDIADIPDEGDTMERGIRIRLGKFSRKIVEFGPVKMRRVIEYVDPLAEQAARGLAFEQRQQARVEAAHAAVKTAREALAQAASVVDESPSARKLRQLSSALERAQNHVPLVETAVEEALTLHRYRTKKRGDAAVRAASGGVRQPHSGLHVPAMRLA